MLVHGALVGTRPVSRANGTRFDENELRALPPGGFYTEPAREPHFARTGRSRVVVQVSGFGPTGTRHVDGPGASSTKP
jgi:hypothetical protein